jgi:hypothetical protein
MTEKLSWAICPHTAGLMAIDDAGYSHPVGISPTSWGRFHVSADGTLFYRSRSGFLRPMRFGWSGGRSDQNKLYRALRTLPIADPV